MPPQRFNKRGPVSRPYHAYVDPPGHVWVSSTSLVTVFQFRVVAGRPELLLEERVGELRAAVAVGQRR
jgi:hypothetical protein